MSVTLASQEFDIFSEESFEETLEQAYNQVRTMSPLVEDYDQIVSEERKYNILKMFLFGLLCIIVGAGSTFAGFKIYAFNKEIDSIDVVPIYQTEQAQTIEYVDGDVITNPEIISDASLVLTKYFQTLHVNPLDTEVLCSDSYVPKYLNNYRSQMRTTLDEYEYAYRVNKQILNSFTLKSIDSVIEKDGKYYCYCTVMIPTRDNLQNYMDMYAYSTLKYFNSHDVDEKGILVNLYENLNTFSLFVGEYNVCMVIDTRGTITEDSMVKDLCEDAYTQLLELTKQKMYQNSGSLF